MISAKLVTCGLCQNYYADPRQIPCSHSFCFDCISGRFNEDTLSLICPKCEKHHQYNSLEEFHTRCMRDGFLASMVTQFKKSQSRLSAIPSGLISRPPSSISRISPAFSSTPIPTSISTILTQENHFNNHDQSGSERSTPLILTQQRPSSVLQQTSPRVLIAKCQSCNIRGELIVCNHCDNVICVKCANEHQSVINIDVQREWDVCKTKFEEINEQSVRFDTDQEEINSKARSLQTFISKQSDKIIQTVENHKNVYIDLIEKHRRTNKQSFAHEQVIDEYESIDKRVGELLRSADITADKINDFLFEIEHLEGRLDNLNKLLDSNELKFPVLTLNEQIDISSLFGTLEFVQSNSKSTIFDPYSLKMTNGYNDSQFKSDEVDFVFSDMSTNSINRNFYSNNKTEQISSLLSIPFAPKKKLLWQIDYFSVPYYVRTYENQIFICDKYGSLAIYKLTKSNDIRQKPTLSREIKLFRENLTSSSISDEDQTIIDSFTIHKLWIIVFKRKKNELHGTIYLFTHDGKLISNGKCIHNYPSRELTVDTEINLLWSLDQKQLCLFYYDLPVTRTNNPEECFHTRHSHVQFSKPFAPIHISVNKNVLAVLDKNRQAVHVYDKKTKQELYEHVNIYSNSTHFCWDMALFSDNSLLIKLDEMSTLKSGPSKHIYLQLDTTDQHNVIGMIEEIDAYGMMITPNDEILIGVRINTKGIVKCYA